MCSDSSLPLDDFGYASTWILTVVMQLTFFAVAFGCGFDLVTDFAGSTNFVLIAWLSFAFGPGDVGRGTGRPLILTSLLTLTRLYLAFFLLYRVIRRKKDARFDETRNDCYVCQSSITAGDIVGWILFAIGFFFQVKADIEKYMFRNNLANKDTFITTGVWSLSRHPNYFGEMAMWWGIWIATASVVFDGEDVGASAITVISPVFTMVILLFLSGMPTAEGVALERYYRAPDGGQKWEEYRQRTSPVIPIPCGLYAKIPLTIKRYFFFEFKFLEYNAPTDPPNPEKVQSESTSIDVIGSHES